MSTSTAPTHEAIVRYRKVLAAEADPAERAAGLREWGTGEATIADARLVGPGRRGAAAVPRRRAALPAPADRGRERHVSAPRLQLELRDEAGLLVASDVVDTAALGWDGGSRSLRYDVARLPLSDGRFHLRLGLADAGGERLLHWLDDALDFLVYPAGEERGVVRLEGSWAAEENSDET